MESGGPGGRGGFLAFATNHPARSEGNARTTYEVLDEIVQIVTAAFGLVAVLAWNTAIQGLFAAVFGEAGDLLAKFVYAVVVTVAVVFITVRLGRLAEKIRKDEDEKGAGAT